MKLLNYLLFISLSLVVNRIETSCNDKIEKSQIEFRIEPHDIELFSIKGDSLSILPSKFWLEKELFKVSLEQHDNVIMDKSKNRYLFYSDTSFYTLKYMHFEYGKNAIYNLSIGDSINKIICNIPKTESQNFKYIQIGVPYAADNGFELFFEKRKLTKVIVANWGD